MKASKPIILASFALFLSVRYALASADADGPKIGDVPPPLVVTEMLQGPAPAEIRWDKFKGKVVVLEFWATWCGPCIKAIPHVNALAEEFQNKPVVFISVTSENKDVARSFIKKNPMRPWIGIDDYEKLNKAFHVEGIPHTVIVGTNGRIAAITHPAQLRSEHLTEVLEGRKCSLPEPRALESSSRSEVVSNERPPLYEVSIRENPLPENFRGAFCSWKRAPDGIEGKLATVESGLCAVFMKTPNQLSLKCKLPGSYYDFKITVPEGHTNEVERLFINALRTTFNLEVKRSTVEMDVFVLTQLAPNAPGLQPVNKTGGGGQTKGGFRIRGCTIDGVAHYLELTLKQPVIDETGLNGLFDVDMKWDVPTGDEQSEYSPPAQAVIDAAKTRLGLLLTPTRRPVEIVEVGTVEVKAVP